ncbi:G-protein coupled receptor GRL101-like isoform X1 [Ptychodera flava]|uniref:G-protein coupled receptor GRL101-like isoform X1 n=1 Tax=Ptychodera flava TaxID=63121 RepID=UPI003969F726
MKDIAVNDDVTELIGGDCATAADNKTGCYIGVNKDKQIADVGNSRACLGMDASDWTVGLMDCDEDITLEMCMTQASVTTHTCGVEAFECAGNECIHPVYVCDGNSDCTNGFDEMRCNMAVACPTNTFQCENGKCVSMTFYCDFIDHCGDNSDEENCVYPNCTVGQFKCDNNQCVDKSKYCDLMEDCYDGSDEKYCDVCNGFQCYYVDCIPEHAKCDGRVRLRRQSNGRTKRIVTTVVLSLAHRKTSKCQFRVVMLKNSDALMVHAWTASGCVSTILISMAIKGMS